MSLRLPLCFTLIASIFVAGCGSVVKNPTPIATVADYSKKMAVGDYKISSGDELDVRFFYTPELNSTVVVRPDGKINLPLVGDIKAAGTSANQLGDTLKKVYADQVKRPDVAINIRGFASHRVFVGGEVGRPGVQPLIGSMSVLQAILMSEGMKDTASSREVVIVRRGENDERLVFSVNLDQVISGDDTSQDILLQPFDVVLVPRSGIANLNSWVDMYIKRNLPINVGFTYTINRYDTTAR